MVLFDWFSLSPTTPFCLPLSPQSRIFDVMCYFWWPPMALPVNAGGLNSDSRFGWISPLNEQRLPGLVSPLIWTTVIIFAGHIIPDNRRTIQLRVQGRSYPRRRKFRNLGRAIVHRRILSQNLGPEKTYLGYERRWRGEKWNEKCFDFSLRIFFGERSGTCQNAAQKVSYSQDLLRTSSVLERLKVQWELEYQTRRWSNAFRFWMVKLAYILLHIKYLSLFIDFRFRFNK